MYNKLVSDFQYGNVFFPSYQNPQFEKKKKKLQNFFFKFIKY